MGIYVFHPRLLERLLRADADDTDSAHDFGRNIVPSAIDKLRVFAYPFEDVRTKAQNYWRDVGTVDAYFEANRRPAGSRGGRPDHRDAGEQGDSSGRGHSRSRKRRCRVQRLDPGAQGDG